MEWYEHIRHNPEKYIGKIGDCSDVEDGIYILLKGLIDSSADEFEMGYAKGLEIEISGLTVSLREYGRGIPLKSVVSATSGISVGIGTKKDDVITNGYKVANALAEEFLVNSYRNAERSWALYSRGVLADQKIEEDKNHEPDGTLVKFTLDKELFPNSYYRQEIVNDIVKRYAEKYKGFSIILNGVKQIIKNNMEVFFMKDDSENNQGYEHMLDFQMSWVMRIPSDLRIKDKNPNLYKRCYEVLMKLIGKNEVDNVVSVRVWKQWKRIDVIAEIEVESDGKKEKHVVIIEDKAYTMIHDDQLNRYKETVSDWYCDKDFKPHYWVITFYSPGEDGYKTLDSMCKKAKWELLSYDNVLEDYTPTGSELFDEFWINEW